MGVLFLQKLNDALRAGDKDAASKLFFGAKNRHKKLFFMPI